MVINPSTVPRVLTDEGVGCYLMGAQVLSASTPVLPRSFFVGLRMNRRGMWLAIGGVGCPTYA